MGQQHSGRLAWLLCLHPDRPRTLHMGDDADRLCWLGLYGLSPQEQDGLERRVTITTPETERPPSGGFSLGACPFLQTRNVYLRRLQDCVGVRFVVEPADVFRDGAVEQRPVLRQIAPWSHGYRGLDAFESTADDRDEVRRQGDWIWRICNPN
jgi:hypothetical protein